MIELECTHVPPNTFNLSDLYNITPSSLCNVTVDNHSLLDSFVTCLWHTTGVLKESKHASATRSSESMATSNRSFLHFLVPHRLHLQLLHFQVPTTVVATIQLRALGSPGYRSCLCRASHLLHSIVWQQKWTELVGQSRALH